MRYRFFSLSIIKQQFELSAIPKITLVPNTFISPIIFFVTVLPWSNTPTTLQNLFLKWRKFYTSIKPMEFAHRKLW